MSEHEDQQRGAEGDARDLLVVGIGASAGGLSALRTMLSAFDEDVRIAFLVVQHLSPNHTSQLASLLQARCQLEVETAVDGTLIRAGHVYVIAPGTELTSEHARLRVRKRASMKPDVERLPVDLLFRSLADDFGRRSVGVVLSGTGTDGTLGVIAISEAGGITIAQSPGEAEYDGMPRSAIETERVDIVADADDIAQRLADHMQMAVLDREFQDDDDSRSADAFSQIIDVLAKATGRDFHDYKPSTLIRRIERRMHVNACADFDAYLEILKSRPSEPDALFRDLLISVTQFFRDPEAFEQLRDEIIPRLLETKGGSDTLRIWVAGCATGEEAYSVAMLAVETIEEMGLESNIQVFATDIDARAIAKARRGRYPMNIAADVRPDRLKRFFLMKNGEYIVHPALREVILFSEHDLLKDPPFSRIDLCLCRNLMIYLRRSVHPRLLRLFHFALRPDGYLFSGLSESAKGIGHLFREVEGLTSVFQTVASEPGKRYMPQFGRERSNVGEILDRMKRVERKEVSIGSVHQNALLSQYAPPSIVVNKHRELVHLTGGAGQIIQMSDGRPTHNISEISPRPLALALRTVLHQRLSNDEDIVEHQVRFESAGEPQRYILRARWLPYADDGDRLVQITFEESREPHPVEHVDYEDADVDQLIEDLENELAYTREQLQVTVEEYETALEELRASNEELQSVNEELHSTTEELETSREELRSVNEELSTVNEELRAKIQELNENQTYLENLLLSTRIGTIFLDLDDRITHFTPAVSKHFSLTPVDVGRPLSDLTHSLEYEGLIEDIVQVRENEENREKEVRSKDGAWYIARMLPLYSVDETLDGVVLSFIDITRRKEAELRLAESEERYRTLFEGANDGIYVYEIDGDVPGPFIDVNPVISERLGWSREELLERTLMGVSNCDVDEFAEMRATLERDGEYMGEREEVTRDGQTVAVEVNCRLMVRDKRSMVLTVSRDFTARKEYEQQLIAAKLAAERLAQMQSSFVANISHEVRTPLTSIIGLSRMLVDRLDEGDSHRMARIIQRSANRLMRTLDSVLTLAKIDAGEAALEVESFDLGEEARRLLSTIEPLAAEKGLSLALEHPDDPVFVVSNREAISRVLSNLVSNAIKFTEEGTVTVGLSARDSDVELTVSDTGVGIDDGFLPHVYDQFRQESVGDSREYGGIGLGLTIVKRIVDLLDGSLDVRSEKGVGTRISVRVPNGRRDAPPDESDEIRAD